MVPFGSRVPALRHWEALAAVGARRLAGGGRDPGTGVRAHELIALAHTDRQLWHGTVPDRLGGNQRSGHRRGAEPAHKGDPARRNLTRKQLQLAGSR
jgi:hypothetical protein